MTVSYLKAFTDSKSGKKFVGGFLYRCDEKSLLTDGKGHIIILDSYTSDLLCNQTIPKRLLSVFKSRGFLDGYSACFCSKSIKPEFFMIDLTSRCNMACKYCLRDIHSDGETMSEEILKQICEYIVDYCNETNLSHVSIQAWGGEPLLEWKSILAMRKWIQPDTTKVHFSIETNATLLSEGILNKLYDARIGIGISIDGTEQCHNKQRVFVSGKETHTIVETNLRRALDKYGKRLGTITTITTQNCNQIADIIEYFAVDLGLRNIKCNFVHESKFAVNARNLCLSKDEIVATELKLLDKIVELTERGYHIQEKNILTKIRNLLFSEYSDICLSRGCNGGKKMIVFDRLGNIYPCELTDFPEEAIGNIRETDKSLIDIVKNSMATNVYFIAKHMEKCDTCPWYLYCGGGCTVRILNSGSQPPAVDEIECAVNSALYPAIIELVLTKPQVINTMLGYEAVVL